MINLLRCRFSTGSSSIKRTIEPRPWAKRRKKLGEIWPCSFRVMRAGRQTNRKKTDIVVTIRGRSINHIFHISFVAKSSRAHAVLAAVTAHHTCISSSGSGSSISAVPGRASIIRRRRCVTEDTHVTSTRQQSRPTGLGLRRQVVVIILVFCWPVAS